jgi:hypothetical protein
VVEEVALAVPRWLRSELCERLETTTPSVGLVETTGPALGTVAGSRDASFGPSFLGPEPTLLDRRVAGG